MVFVTLSRTWLLCLSTAGEVGRPELSIVVRLLRIYRKERTQVHPCLCVCGLHRMRRRHHVARCASLFIATLEYWVHHRGHLKKFFFKFFYDWTRQNVYITKKIHLKLKEKGAIFQKTLNSSTCQRFFRKNCWQEYLKIQSTWYNQRDTSTISYCLPSLVKRTQHARNQAGQTTADRGKNWLSINSLYLTLPKPPLIFVWFTWKSHEH